MPKHCLVVGGSSGYGLQLAKKLAGEYQVTVTGRHDPEEPGLDYERLDLSGPALILDITNLVSSLPAIDLLVYAAGYHQTGTITKLHATEIYDMVEVGLLAPMLLVQALLDNQPRLDGFIAVTSTSQVRPRLEEPVYCAAKAGFGHFANSLALDPRVGKTLVMAPGGMVTPFWKGSGVDTSDMLDPAWVADRTHDLFGGEFTYMWVIIPRHPGSMEVRERR